MKLYYKDNIVVATHADDQAPDPSIYGEGVLVADIADDISLERIGTAPTNPLDVDSRPFKVPGFDLAALKDQAKAQIVNLINNFSNSFTAGYPQSEILSWGTKDAAARAYVAGQTLSDSQSLLLNTEKTVGNYPTLDALCETIIEKSNAFVKISGTIAGIRVASTQAIDDATNAQGIDAVLNDVKQKLVVK